MEVPSSSQGGAFQPASVLLLLAGTGVVALPQILHHRDPYGKVGIPTKRKQEQLHIPIDMILSCRSDDVLLLPEIKHYCQEANDFVASRRAVGEEPQEQEEMPPVTKGLRHCTLLLTTTPIPMLRRMSHMTGRTSCKPCPIPPSYDNKSHNACRWIWYPRP